MYNKIILPLDGSDHSKKAIEYAKEIASKFGSQILLFYSYEVTDKISEAVAKIDSGLREQFDEMEKHTQNYANEMLTEIQNELKGLGIEANKIIQKGKAGADIVSTIEKEECDLAIMGRRGLGNLKSALIGSTSNYVLHHTNCPVFLVN